MEELEVGMYVRTNLGIGTVHRIYNNHGDCYVRFSKNVIKKWVNISKSSNNIIGLIEAGDYVNGHLVQSIDKVPNEKIGLVINTTTVDGKDGETLNIYKEEIETVVTKEQFASNEYHVK